MGWLWIYPQLCGIGFPVARYLSSLLSPSGLFLSVKAPGRQEAHGSEHLGCVDFHCLCNWQAMGFCQPCLNISPGHIAWHTSTVQSQTPLGTCWRPRSQKNSLGTVLDPESQQKPGSLWTYMETNYIFISLNLSLIVINDINRPCDFVNKKNYTHCHIIMAGAEILKYCAHCDSEIMVNADNTSLTVIHIYKRICIFYYKAFS